MNENQPIERDPRAAARTMGNTPPPRPGVAHLQQRTSSAASPGDPTRAQDVRVLARAALNRCTMPVPFRGMSPVEFAMSLGLQPGVGFMCEEPPADPERAAAEEEARKKKEKEIQDLVDGLRSEDPKKRESAVEDLKRRGKSDRDTVVRVVKEEKAKEEKKPDADKDWELISLLNEVLETLLDLKGAIKDLAGALKKIKKDELRGTSALLGEDSMQAMFDKLRQAVEQLGKAKKALERIWDMWDDLDRRERELVDEARKSIETAEKKEAELAEKLGKGQDTDQDHQELKDAIDAAERALSALEANHREK